MSRKPKTKAKPATSTSRWDAETQFVLWLATCVSVISALFYFQRNEVLLYGDAIAHINIARRVFDSRTPGLLQLGTVWLPLPHLLMIPFLLSDSLWRTGLGGSLPSMAAYVLGVVGMFRLVRGVFSGEGKSETAARAAAWTAALVFAANPNLIYMQTTAMGEALYLAFFIWAVVFFSEAIGGDSKALTKCGFCLAAACLTRYDGWFLTVAMSAAIMMRAFLQRRGQNKTRFSQATIAKFLLLSAFAPILWLAYNGIVYRNPLEFENGPYSAKAIERKTQTAENPGHPGSGNLLVAGSYLLKAAELNMAHNDWLQRGWILLIAASLAAVALSRNFKSEAAGPPWLPCLFLLIPIPFYALSIAYGGVPIFVPPWRPFSHYNVRYGLQLLPAFAASFAVLVFLVRRGVENGKIRLAALLAMFGLLTASYVSVWQATPVSLKEAQLNMRTRNVLEAQVAGWLQKLPSDSTFLMYLGDHVGALQQAGIPLKRTINEGNHRVWMQPSDPDGVWERALADPTRYADYAIAAEGDPVWQSVQERPLPEIVELHVTGQARVVLYRLR
jgi:hypothetical protein